MKAQQLLLVTISVATLKVFTKGINVQRYRPKFLQVDSIEMKGGIRGLPATRSIHSMDVPSLSADSAEPQRVKL
jgi:hypothetical protein